MSGQNLVAILGIAFLAGVAGLYAFDEFLGPPPNMKNRNIGGEKITVEKSAMPQTGGDVNEQSQFKQNDDELSMEPLEQEMKEISPDIKQQYSVTNEDNGYQYDIDGNSNSIKEKFDDDDSFFTDTEKDKGRGRKRDRSVIFNYDDSGNDSE